MCRDRRAEDPLRPAARRRTVRGRTLQDPAGTPRRAGCHAYVADGHLAPAAADPRPGRPGPHRAGRAVRAPGRLRGGARQRRRHGVLGRRHGRADRAAQPAPVLRRVLVQVRLGGQGRAVAGRAVDHRQRARFAPRRPRRGRRRRLRLGAQRDLDRRDGTGAAAGRRGRRRAGADRRHLGRRRPAGRPRRDRRLLLRTAEVVRLRRRPVDRDVLPGGPGAGRADRGVRPTHPGVLRPADGDRQLPQEPDLQHARRSPPSS